MMSTAYFGLPMGEGEAAADTTAHDGPLGVFSALASSGLRYAVWKDVYDVPDFGRGDAELDIVVPPEELDGFREIARAHCYAEYRNLVDFYGGHLTHFIRFDAGRHYHLHVHDSLLSGDHTAKEYRLDSLFGPELFEGPTWHGLSIVARPDELLLGIVRLILKVGSGSDFKPAELARLRAIADPETFRAATEKLTRGIAPTNGMIDDLREALGDPGADVSRLARHRPAFEPLRRLSQAETAAVRAAARVLSALTYAVGLSNKRLARPAPSISIVGVDGSGKSTVASTVHQMLASKTSARIVYLGGNADTYTPMTRAAYLMWGASSVLRRRASRSSAALQLNQIMLALFEYAKCKDRVRRIRFARLLSRLGIVVVFERFPVKFLFDYPKLAAELAEGAEELEGVPRRLVESIIRRIDEQLEAAGRADVMVILETPLDVIEARRQPTAEERTDIVDKVETLRRFKSRGLDGSFVVLDNSGDLEDCIAKVSELLNRQLCS